LVDPTITKIAEDASRQIARAERLDLVSTKEIYRTIIEAIISAVLARSPSVTGAGAMREALNAIVNWYTPPNDSKPFPIKIVVDALADARSEDWARHEAEIEPVADAPAGTVGTVPKHVLGDLQASLDWRGPDGIGHSKIIVDRAYAELIAAALAASDRE
jgi:hypothetical protein